MADGLGVLSESIGGCLAAVAASVQYNICNTRAYGTDATCADNCCRFNCGWKQGPLPVEDYPIANSEAQQGDAKKEESEGGALPAYTATPQMSASPPADVAPAPEASKAAEISNPAEASKATDVKTPDQTS
ncbi:uncharacterized protein PAN0_029c6196 [Moesziomyces antarcticus]|uniref:Uncharacterized protein n=2 Tax=Pseudozyma antarctica TaxID=84753 RepID=A0A081CMS0_PSEA2|nr:uncharacterized protein PAN0_029c6196 [Moesziomyces antarcticus]GAK67966.1 hypothetical protein PAN0_029c6196 [Moesziomyces antarcticus]SPO47307.1 uncharacterized protein PSANT_04995 [Moesziomyces antarcticus]